MGRDLIHTSQSQLMREQEMQKSHQGWKMLETVSLFYIYIYSYFVF